LGEKPTKRLRELEKHLSLILQRDDLSVELCALYNQTGRHEKALDLVTARNFQPWEGGEGGPLGQWVRSHLALGRKALRSVAAGILPAVELGFQPGGKNDGKWKGLKNSDASKTCDASSGRQDAALYVRQGCPTLQATAVAHFFAALTAPLNLGEARHLLANQSDIHYWLGCALAAAGEVKSARQHWRMAATFKGDFQEMSVRAFSEMTYYSALAWEKLGHRAKAKQLFRDLLAYARQLQKTQAKIDYFATSLPTMLLFDDDVQFRQETTALFLQAQAQLGLGKRDQAKKLLTTVLKRDPNHALAADLNSQNH
jgi:tetratricopeptide (TPR) repeat protein